MKSKIVVDSSSNVYELPDVDFACVPLKILTDEQEYVDTAEVDAPALAEKMRTYKGRTSTSCPNISDWMAAYEGADEVYVVTITGTLSGAYNAALLAGEEYEQSHEGARVFVLDSLSTGAESRLLVERLAALMAAAAAHGLEPKRMRMVQHTAQSAPSLLLLECRRGGKPGLSVEPPLLLHLPDGGESPDVRRAYFRDKE